MLLIEVSVAKNGVARPEWCASCSAEVGKGLKLQLIDTITNFEQGGHRRLRRKSVQGAAS